MINDKFVLNPSNEELLESSLDLVVAGTKKGVLMVESEANELSENIINLTNKNNLNVNDLDYISVALGTGGFTSIRVGILSLIHI